MFSDLSDPEMLTFSHGGAALVKSDVLAPIAFIGQYLLLDHRDVPPNDGDLVVVETFDGDRLARRFWRYEGCVNLEAANPTTPAAPIVLPTDQCSARRVIGVLFEGPNCRSGGVGEEWAAPGDLKGAQFKGIFGIRVDGTSFEPIARDGQVVLAKKVEELSGIANGTLACFDIDGIGAVLKRCYSVGDKWILCPANPVEVEEPILIDVSAVFHAYKIVGVLFEPGPPEKKREV